MVKIEKLEELLKWVGYCDTFLWSDIDRRLGTRRPSGGASAFFYNLLYLYELHTENDLQDHPVPEHCPSFGSLEEDCRYIADLLGESFLWHSDGVLPDANIDGMYWAEWHGLLTQLADGVSFPPDLIMSVREEPEEFPEFIV